MCVRACGEVVVWGKRSQSGDIFKGSSGQVRDRVEMLWVGNVRIFSDIWCRRENFFNSSEPNKAKVRLKSKKAVRLRRVHMK